LVSTRVSILLNSVSPMAEVDAPNPAQGLVGAAAIDLGEPPLNPETNGPHSLSLTAVLGEGHPALALNSGNAVRECLYGCGTGSFGTGQHAGKMFVLGALASGLQKSLCSSHLRPKSDLQQPPPPSSIGQGNGSSAGPAILRGPPPGQPGGCSLYREAMQKDLGLECVCKWAGFTHPESPPKAATTKPMSVSLCDPLVFKPLTFTDGESRGESPIARLQKVCFRSFSDTRLDRLDPLSAFSADTKLLDHLGGRRLDHARADAQGSAFALVLFLVDVQLRKLSRVWGALKDPAIAARTNALCELEIKSLSADWSSSVETISVVDLLESALSDAFEVTAVLDDFAHSSLLADVVYHGRQTGVYKYSESMGGALTRGSWLFAKVKESQVSRFQTAVHRSVASPRRPLADAIENCPVVQFAVADLLRDQPALMTWFAAKHARILDLQREASTLQKPFTTRYSRLPPTKRLAGGERERGPHVDTHGGGRGRGKGGGGDGGGHAADGGDDGGGSPGGGLGGDGGARRTRRGWKGR
jgi:uncharacterized membrane protein YgcG